MVSDSDLIIRLREFLQSSDLNTTTTAIVRRKLEEEFDVDLSDKKAFIREQVDLFLQSQNEEKPEPEGEDSSGEEEKPNVKSEPNGSVSKEHGDYSGDESEDEAEEEEEEEGATSKRRTVRKKQVSKKEGNSDVKKKGGGGFTKVCSLSPQLQEFLGIPECARTEVVKQIWAYIREKNLQDPSNRRNILCDEALHALFRVDSINMFQMTKALSKHIWPLESEDAPEKSSQKEKPRKQERREDPDDPKPKEKKQKAGASGFLAPLQLSDALVKFFGTGESVLKRSEVVKKMWEYIKQNNLQDPSDKKTILCDDKFRELFEVDSFVGFTITKLLAAHFTKVQR